MAQKNNKNSNNVKRSKVHFYYYLSIIVFVFVASFTYYVTQYEWILYRKAENAFEKKDYPTAIKYYEKAIDKDVDLWYVVDHLSQACQAAGECYNVTTVFENLVKRKPDSIYILMTSATFFVNLKRYDLAIPLFKKALKLKPRDHKILKDLAKAYKWNEQYLLAIKTYETLMMLQKKPSIKLYLEIGDCYLLDESYYQAIKYYNMVLKEEPDSQEVLKKLNLAYSWTGKEDEGVEKLYEIYQENPDDFNLAIQIFKIYMQDRKYQKANEILSDLLKKYPKNEDVIYQAALYEITQGHFDKANNIYKKILKDNGHRQDLLITYADLSVKFFDFYQAENILRKQVDKNPNNLAAIYGLIDLYIEMNRYFEAENLLFQLIDKNIFSSTIYEKIAIVQYEKRDFKNALYWINKALFLDPVDSEATVLKTKILIKLDQKKLALEEIQNVPRSFLLKEEGHIAIAKLYLELNEIELAKKSFSEAIRLEPDNLVLRFYADYLIYKNKELIQSYFKKDLSALQYQKIADIISESYPEDAIIFYKKAIQLDPNNFLAKLNLSLNLSALKRYDESLKYLFDLDKKYPNNYKILISIANNYENKKDFSNANKYYQTLYDLDGYDYLLLQSWAHLAYREKNPKLAKKIYSKRLYPSVDKLLYNSLKKQNLLSKIARYQDIDFSNNTTIKFYEKISFKYNTGKYPFNEEDNKKLKTILVNLKSTYQIQKLLYLESKSKWFLYLEEYIHAIEVLNELIAFYPANTSALFDLAQANCQLKQCDIAKKLYKDILQINPKHEMAHLALKTTQIKSNPFFQADHEYYEEAGRGDLDRVIQNKTDLSFSYPLYCRHWLTFIGNRYNDKPTFAKDSEILNKDQLAKESYTSYGYEVEYKGAFTNYSQLELGFSQKYYLKQFKRQDMGFLHYYYNLKDYAKLGFGFDRETKIDNIFSLTNDILTNTFWFSSESLIRKRFEINANAKYYLYSDKNEIGYLNLDIAYRMMLYPHIFRMKLSGEYRDSSHENIFVYTGPFITNIIHPYWTPKNYKAYRASLDWYHDISKYLYCSNQLHYYFLKLMSGSDTEKNPTIAFEGGYHLEFKDHYTIGISGLLHRSKLWNSQEIKAFIKYQF